MTTTTLTPERVQATRDGAFREGRDARHAGEPMDANPYTAARARARSRWTDEAAHAWELGWRTEHHRLEAAS